MNKILNTTPIERVLSDYRKGKLAILVDDENRENEGDLLVAAECVTDEHINFMASHGRGLICLTLTEERCKQLDLPLMVGRNNARFSTNFTVSIEASEGVTTGISAQDRAMTIRTAVKHDARPRDLVTPGHIFPIKAQTGGILTRAGHTEAGVDIARLCGYEPASVICEILKEDGTMARLPDLLKFAQKHDIKIGTISDLIGYRLKHDITVKCISKTYLQLKQGNFQLYVYHDTLNGSLHMALLHGKIDPSIPIPVRLHVHRGILDLLIEPFSQCEWTLDHALQSIASQERGIVLIISYHESPDELVKRIDLKNDPCIHRRHQKENDSNQTFNNLSIFGAGSQILSNLGVTKILSIGHSNHKSYELSKFGFEIVKNASNSK